MTEESKGIYLDATDGKLKDISTDEELPMHELEHSEYGLIKYVEYQGVNVVYWTDYQENELVMPLPSDWEDEIEE